MAEKNQTNQGATKASPQKNKPSPVKNLAKQAFNATPQGKAINKGVDTAKKLNDLRKQSSKDLAKQAFNATPQGKAINKGIDTAKKLNDLRKQPPKDLAKQAFNATPQGKAINKGIDTAKKLNDLRKQSPKDLAKQAFNATPQGKAINKGIDTAKKVKKGYDDLKNKVSKNKKDADDPSNDNSKKEDALSSDASSDQTSSQTDKQEDIKEENVDLLHPLGKEKDGLKKNLKRAARVVQAANTGGKLFALYYMFKQMMMMFMALMRQLFGWLFALVSKISAFFQAIIGAISSFIQGVVGVTSAIANGIAVAFVTIGMFMTSFAVYTYADNASKQTETIRSDTSVACEVNEKESVVSDGASLISIGDVAQAQLDSAQKIYSVMHEVGYSDNFIAAVLGNFQIESGLDPTSVETIYTEPYQIGPRKQAAIKAKFDVMAIDAAYGSEYPAIKTVGRGLGQWTNERGDLLVSYAEKTQHDWWDGGTQLAFMISADSRSGYMKQSISNNMSVEAATQDFLVNWEGNPGDKVGERTAQAKFWLAKIKTFTVQKEYADSIVNKMDVNMADLNHATAQKVTRLEEECAPKNPTDDILDGTGVWPDDVQGWAWTPDSLPASLKKYTHDPEKYGLQYKGTKGWIENSGQCVDFSNSYYSVLYPKQAGITYGNGTDTAERWAERFGGKTSNIPHKGSVFSNDNAYSKGAGHTGIVEHVFANGDILIIEQNTAPYSGIDADKIDTWNWRKITKQEYQGKMKGTMQTWNWRFFKPDRVKSAWEKGKKSSSSKGTKDTSESVAYDAKNASALTKEGLKHLGKPYVWGGKGPYVFDCSGFTRYVYLQVTGKDIGGWTVPQESSGQKISVNDAKEGDLYFWGPDGNTSHVALAIGGGKFIEAPQPGDVVHISSVGVNLPSFAVRPNV